MDTNPSRPMLIDAGSSTATSMAGRLLSPHGAGRTAVGAGLVGRRTVAEVTCQMAWQYLGSSCLQAEATCIKTGAVSVQFWAVDIIPFGNL